MSDTDTTVAGYDMTGTQRELGSRTIAAGDARTVLIRRRYDAEPEDVWGACTDPDRLRRWFLPVTGELRAGGHFDLAGNAHGDILQCEPPTLLAITWAYADRAVDEVRLRLTPDGDGTLLELEHASVSRLVEVDGRWIDPVLNDAASGLWGLGTGWELPLHGLAQFLAGHRLEFDPTAPPADIMELADHIGRAWHAVVTRTATPTTD